MRAVPLALVAAGALAAVAPSAHGATKPQAIDVIVRTKVSLAGREGGTIESRIFLMVPRDRGAVGHIVGERRGSSRFRAAMNELLVASGLRTSLDAFSDPVFERIQGDLAEPVHWRVLPHRLEIELRTFRRLAGSLHPSFGPRGSGPWEIATTHDGLLFSFRRRRTLPAGSRWTIDLKAGDQGFVDLRPTPARAAGGSRALWRLQHAAPPLVAAEIPISEGERMELATGGRGWDLVRELSTYFWRLLLFVGALVLAVAWAKPARPPAALRRLASAAVGATFLTAAALVIGRMSFAVDAHRAQALLPAAGVILLAWIPAFPRRRSWAAAFFVVLVAAAAGVTAYADYDRRSEGAYADAAFAVASVAYVACLAGVGAVAVAALLTAGGPRSGRRSPRQRRAAALVGAAVGVALALQAFGWAAKDWSSFAERYTLVPSWTVVDRREHVVGTALYFPQLLAGLLLSLVPLVLLGLIVAHATSWRSSRVRTRFGVEPSARRKLTALAAALFATFVVGLGGTVLDIEVPLAFVLSFALLRLVLRRRDVVAADLSSARAVGTTWARAQDTLLRLANESDVLRRRRRKAYARFVESDDDAATYRHTLDGLDREERDRRRRSGNVAAGRLALALGPRRSWRGNARAALAVAAPLALLPIGFYLYSTQFVEHRGTRGSIGFGYLVQGLLYETAFWLVAAFVLGALYPHLIGRTGALRGAALAGVYAASQALATWILPGRQAPWAFRALELLVFMAVVGIALDARTLRDRGLPWQHLVDRYQARDLRVVASYASPLLVSIILIVAQVRSGHAQNAAVEILKAIPGIPNVPTTSK